MDDSLTYKQAMVLLERAYRSQMRGELGEAIELYERSIAVHPTAEAHTYLGWTYSMMDRYDEAIEQCEQAIQIDPTFGNPYNDIGAYLIELGKYDDSIEWLQKALDAERYDYPQFAYLNLGRVYQRLGKAKTALQQYEEALSIDPLYRPAVNAKFNLLSRLN